MKNLKMKAFKSTKGITLIALVVTIIILLILAGVSIAMLTGNNGILTQGKRAKEEQAHAAVKEGIMLLYNEYKTKQEVNASKVQEETKVASTEFVKIAENEGAEGTTENLGSFKDFIQSKNIINSDGIINVRNLLGQTLSLGNGTSKESGDVYVFEEQDDYYNLTYYNKQIQQAKIYQIKNENAGEKLIATHYFDSYTGSGRIILVDFEKNQHDQNKKIGGIITCPDGSKKEISEENSWIPILYDISQPGTYTFTAVTSEGKSSKVEVKVEVELSLECKLFDGLYLTNGFEKNADITSENNPKVKYIKDSVEQEGDLTDCIENGEISVSAIRSKFGLSSKDKVEITVEVNGKELKWSGYLTVPE